MSNYLASKISGLDKRRLKVSLMSLGGAVFGIVLFSFTKNPLFCGSGFWGGQRPSLAHCVTGMGPMDGATAAGGRSCCLSSL